MLKNTEHKLAIVCEQKSVPKIKVTETWLRKSNKNGFGEDIGTITNRVTAMFDVLASLEPTSEEYSELMDRIICGQAYQQESIDRIKGIEAKKMPKEWFDYKTNKITEDDGEEQIATKNKNIKLMVNKKPYFFIYNYEHLMNKYRKFMKDTKSNCLLRFGCTVEELMIKTDKTEDEEKFAKSIVYKSPVFNNPCVMNKICWRIEREYENIKMRVKNNDGFDFNIYKSDRKYKKDTYKEIENIYKEYKKKLKQYSETIKVKVKGDFKVNFDEQKQVFLEDFRIRCSQICPNSEELCNIVLDIVYKTNSNKQFAWDICGEQIIKNLLLKNNNIYSYPILDEDGDIEWKGNKFSIKEVEICEE